MSDDNKKLSDMQHDVLKNKATEAPFSGRLLNVKDKGMFVCADCGQPLFSSDTKFDSGTGWPSFYDVATKGNVKTIEDNSNGMHRLEVVCSKCGGHLGHVFEDGPKDATGLRYCINSAALNFHPEDDDKDMIRGDDKPE